MMTELLIAILVAVCAGESTHVLEWTAHVLIKRAVRLSHGQTPRALIRLVEETGNLRDCGGQFGKLGFALRLTGRGIAERLGQAVCLLGPLSSASACENMVYRAAAEAVGHALRGVDMRVLDRSRRRETENMIARLRELLRVPAEAFDEEGSAMLLTMVAPLSEAFIAARDEPAALRLIRDAQSHLARLGHCHPAVLGVRRVHASALCELGYYQQAEALLDGLSADERQTLGHGDPQTFATRQVHAWAVAGQGRHAEAEACLGAVKALLSQSSDADMAQLRHVECKANWVVGQQDGRAEESAEAYDRVIADRSRELGPDHPDCLDAVHSKGKMHVMKSGDGPRALAVLEPLLDKRARVQGPLHSDTLETRKYVAVARVLKEPLNTRIRNQAIHDLRKILRIQAERHSTNYPMTTDTAAWLSTLTQLPER
jgi:hypothetical protein